MRSGGSSPAALRRALLGWYRRQRRDLPWRRTADPYRVWLSEVMLQQTTVATALPYYEAFLARFPDLETLAAAPLEDVLARWAGLGYYRRARHLHAAARELVARHGGRFPRDLEAALALPGVGPYTARAVLSIAYGVPEPVVDGNVRRVLARLLLLRGPGWRDERAFHEPAARLLARGAPGDWNQALMELGATACAPRAPACPACPLARHCRARAAGLQEQLPEKKPRARPREVLVTAALVERAGRVLLTRRHEGGAVLAGFWELPQAGLESPAEDPAAELRERLGLRLGPLLGQAGHAITFRRIRARVHAARLERPLPRGDGRWRWAAPGELAGLPLTTLTRKLLQAARAARQRPLAFDTEA